MAGKILGPRGSKRRKRFWLVPILAGAFAMIFWVTGAQAVHDLFFELDGNATTQGTTPFKSSGTVDWASIIQASGTPVASLPSNFSHAGFDKDFKNTGSTFSTDDPTTFATGSKDTLPISTGWQCNDDNNVNSAIDVMNAFSVQYDDPNLNTDGGHDQILYFGLERNANTGDANIGFWFLQDNVGCTSPSSGSASFTGQHQDGDLLIVSAFTKGGSVSTIDVYRWNRPDPSQPGSLGTTSVAHGVDCRATGTGAGDTACAAANTSAITVPWLTSAKTSGVGNSDPTSEFFEGGLNLTKAHLGGKCFNVFIGDTRSSQSLTATIFDYALGTSGSCTSGITTTPQTGAGDPISSVNIPTAASNTSLTVRDHANITVTGVPSFGGTVTFYLCGPLALDTTSNCSTGGAQIGSAVTVSGSNGAASLNSDDGANNPATLTSIGRYCWRAEYSGDSATGVPASKDPSNASNTSECFVVNPITPTLVTAASCSANPCVLASTTKLSDTATITGSARQPGTGGLGGAETIAAGSINPTTPGSLAGGSITWKAYGPGDCTTVAMAQTSRTIGGDGTYPKTGPPDSQSPVNFTPTAVGEYTFTASYGGNSPNTNSVVESACPDTTNTEKVTVGGSAALSTAQKWLPNDTAHVTSQAGTTLAGTVTFTLYNTADCTGTAQYSPAAINITSGSGTANDRTVSTSNTTFVVTTANDASAWSWKVSYNDNALQDPSDSCETTTPAFTLTDS